MEGYRSQHRQNSTAQCSIRTWRSATLVDGGRGVDVSAVAKRGIPLHVDEG